MTSSHPHQPNDVSSSRIRTPGTQTQENKNHSENGERRTENGDLFKYRPLSYLLHPPRCWIAFSSRFAALSSSIVAALCRARLRTTPLLVCFPQLPPIIFAKSGTSRSSQSSSVHGTPFSTNPISLRFTSCRIRSIVTWSNQPFRSCDASALH